MIERHYVEDILPGEALDRLIAAGAHWVVIKDPEAITIRPLTSEGVAAVRKILREFDGVPEGAIEVVGKKLDGYYCGSVNLPRKGTDEKFEQATESVVWLLSKGCHLEGVRITSKTPLTSRAVASFEVIRGGKEEKP